MNPHDPKKFSYEVRLEVSLPRAWTTLLKQVSSHHYDYVCREAGKCGVINGLHNTTCDGEFPSSYRVTWRDLDLITKVMEQVRHHPDDAGVAPAIHQWLRESKDAIEARHRAIVGYFDDMITADTITDSQIQALHALHAALDAESGSPGHNTHTAVMLMTAIALGVVSEAYPGDRLAARERCAEAIRARHAAGLDAPKGST